MKIPTIIKGCSNRDIVEVVFGDINTVYSPVDKQDVLTEYEYVLDENGNIFVEFRIIDNAKECVGYKLHSQEVYDKRVSKNVDGYYHARYRMKEENE